MNRVGNKKPNCSLLTHCFGEEVKKTNEGTRQGISVIVIKNIAMFVIENKA